MHAARRPDLGHVVAFEGALLHGGDPIVSGERYIIAAFLYATRARSGHGTSASGVDAGARRGTKRGCADASGPAPAGSRSAGGEQAAPFRFNL